MNTWVYIDHFKGEALPASWEAVGLGKPLARLPAWFSDPAWRP